MDGTHSAYLRLYVGRGGALLVAFDPRLGPADHSDMVFPELRCVWEEEGEERVKLQDEREHFVLSDRLVSGRREKSCPAS